MKKLSADYIFDGFQLHENAVLVTNVDGTIEGVFSESDFELSETEHYKGILAPGFVNAHCHLELSHLKNVIPRKTGLPGFIRKIPDMRHFPQEKIIEAASAADRQMKENGIVAVGDISNTTDSFSVKQKSSIYYHTFIETYGFAPFKAQKAFDNAVDMLSRAEKAGLNASIVPHAPYSVSDALFQLLKKYYAKTPSLISIHNQETETENEMFIHGKGELLEILKDFGNDVRHWKAQGKSALLSVLDYLDNNSKVIFVHNTFTSPSEINLAEKRLSETYWCICPKANLYIEDTLPSVDRFMEVTDNICIGTDSLASNNTLSIVEEIETLRLHFPHIGLSELLRFATINGAKALGIDTVFGSFEKGKKPGINLLTFNGASSRLSGVKRLM
ncbi:MAG: amidohydrolase [Bacteroidetes bacterium]|nr:MAG: amidohydrolase [Bacteroidota bacterium]